MNGVHDMGGMDGFGKVEPEPNEPMFHTEWEARVLAMVRAMGAAGAFNIDTSRFYREMLPPHVYLASSYYKKWFLGLEDMLVDKGFIAAEDVAAGHAVQPPKPLKRGKFALDGCRARHGARQIRPRRHRPPRSSRPAIASARRTFIRQPTQGCRAMCAAMSAWSSAITVATYFPIRPRWRPESTRNGSILSCSMAPSCGARTPIRP